MSQFAKLFETDKGQILVKIDRNKENNPEVRFYVMPEGLGVATVASSYSDDNEGWDKAEAWFASIDRGKAIETTAFLYRLFEE